MTIVSSVYSTSPTMRLLNAKHFGLIDSKVTFRKVYLVHNGEFRLVILMRCVSSADWTHFAQSDGSNKRYRVLKLLKQHRPKYMEFIR